MSDEPKTYTICGAKNRRGTLCQKPPIRGRNRCKLHGGYSPVGTASSSFKTGRWSRYLPRDLTEKYETAQQDPQSKSFSPDLNLLDAKIAALLADADQGNPTERLNDVQTIWDRLLEQRRRNNDAGVNQCLLEMDRALRGNRVVNTWSEIYECLELRRKILEAEQKRLKDHQQMISIEELLVLTRFLSDSIKSAVLNYADPESARRIILEVSRDLSLCLSRYASPRTQLTPWSEPSSP